jgi:putative two-component system response regulator
MTMNSTILVVDDEPENRRLMRLMLEGEGYRVREAVDGVAALEEVGREVPDLVMLDVVMPRMDGYTVCKKLKSDPATRLLPVLMLTALDQVPDKVKALDADADEYLTKPASLTELKARVRSLLRLKQVTGDLEDASNILAAIAALAEKRDAYVSEHCHETSRFAVGVAGKLGLPEEARARLRLGAIFHDLGKIALPDSILQKAGPLDPAEIESMRRHPVIGAGLLEPMRTLRAIVPLVRHHHERLDGSGYPDGLKGEQISLEIRVMSVVDVYQALIAVRPYKKAMPSEKALGILRQEVERGWWDGKVVDCLAELVASGETAA